MVFNQQVHLMANLHAKGNFLPKTGGLKVDAGCEDRAGQISCYCWTWTAQDCSWKTVKSAANDTSVTVVMQWKYRVFCFSIRWFCSVSTSSGFCWQEAEWIVGPPRLCQHTTDFTGKTAHFEFFRLSNSSVAKAEILLPVTVILLI